MLVAFLLPLQHILTFCLFVSVANDGTKIYIRTNKDAPKYKLSVFDFAEEKVTLKDIIPHDEDAMLKSTLALPHGKLAAIYSRNVRHPPSMGAWSGRADEYEQVKDELYIYDLATGTRETQLASDFIGTLSISGRRELQTQLIITQTGFTTPGTVASYDLSLPAEKRAMEVWQETKLKGLNLSEFEAEQVWYESADGTKIPMFVVKHKDTKFDGTAPVIQYGGLPFSILTIQRRTKG